MRNRSPENGTDNDTLITDRDDRNSVTLLSCQRRRTRILLLLLVAVFALGVWSWMSSPKEQSIKQLTEVKNSRPASKAHVNKLKIGETGKEEAVDIEVEPATELDFKSRAEIFGLRTEAINKYSQLSQGGYQPSKEVFGRVEDGAPWWGLTGIFYGSGEKSIEGPSEHSISIMNPYLLVVPQYWVSWNPAMVSANDLGSDMYPVYCQARSLRWYPRESRAEAAYDAACASRMPGVIDLMAYNAKDFGLNYIYVSYRDSINISKENAPAAAYKNPQFLHRGGSCGYPGGCNNVSPATPPIDDIKIEGFPAKIVIWLWQADPKTVEKPPDMTFIMRFE